MATLWKQKNRDCDLSMKASKDGTYAFRLSLRGLERALYTYSSKELFLSFTAGRPIVPEHVPYMSCLPQMLML